MLAFSTSHPNASRSNLNRLGEGRDWNYNKSSCRWAPNAYFRIPCNIPDPPVGVCRLILADAAGVIASRLPPLVGADLNGSAGTPPLSCASLADYCWAWNWFHGSERCGSLHSILLASGHENAGQPDSSESNYFELTDFRLHKRAIPQVAFRLGSIAPVCTSPRDFPLTPDYGHVAAPRRLMRRAMN